MAEVAKAYIAVTPKFTGFKSAVEKELNSISSSAKATGEKVGSSFSSSASGGIAKSGALIGAFSAITQTALNAISSSLGSAISRFDILNNYPSVMKSLGYSTEEAQGSIQKMSDRLQTLPTTLDSMVSTVQGLSVITKDLDKATNLGLALNDMVIAGGASTQASAAALEQFRQILSKGKPEMQDWKTLMQVMPGQMDQLAKSMLGAEASTDDLYAALGGGKNDPTITMDELMDAVIRLDKEGGENFASFQEQAETASGGVATSMANMQNAIVRGLASVMDEIGKDTIAGVFNDMKGGIKTVFAGITDIVREVKPELMSVYNSLKEELPKAFNVVSNVFNTLKPAIIGVYEAFKTLIPNLITGYVSFKTLSKAANIASIFTNGASSLKKFREAIQLTAGGAGTLKESFKAVGLAINPVTAAIGAVSIAVGVLAPIISDYIKKNENAEKATHALSDAVGDTGNLDLYASNLKNVSSSAKDTTVDLDALNESIIEHAEKINENNAKAQEEISILNSAQQIISEYAGKTDLSTDAQGRLEWALSKVNDEFGLSLTKTDVANNAYDVNGEHVDNLKDKIYQLIDARKNDLRMQTLQDNYTETYQAYDEASQAYADLVAQKDKKLEVPAWTDFGFWAELSAYNEGITASGGIGLSAQEYVLKKYNDELAEAKNKVDECSTSLTFMENQMGSVAQETSESADAYDQWAAKLDNTSKQIYKMFDNQNTGGMAAFKEDLRTLGVSAEMLNDMTEPELEELAQNYDGTCLSILRSLQDMGKNSSEVNSEMIQNAIDLANAIAEVPEKTKILDEAGINVNDFALILSEAGIKADELKNMSDEDFRTMAESCQGNINAMIAAIQVYNSVGLINKDGTVNVNTAQLTDALGNIYTWNGEALVDKTGTIAVDGTQVSDALGNTLVWNQSELKTLDGTAVIHGNVVDGTGEDGVNNTNDAITRLGDKTVTVDANGNYERAAVGISSLARAIASLNSANVSVNANASTTGNAAGGIRPRYHAHGAIAKKAVPLDIVGEAGAEAIVPLTNKHYSRPFASLIADLVNEGQTDAYAVIAWLANNLGSIIATNAPNLVIDNEAGAMIVDSRLSDYARRAAMNRG